MVDLNVIPRYPQKKPLRDYDVDPLLLEIDGHMFVVKNNEVLHLPRLCKWKKKIGLNINEF